jgi:plastocyanin
MRHSDKENSMRVMKRNRAVRTALPLLMLVGAAASSTSCFSERSSGGEGPIAPQPGPDGVVEITLTANWRFEPADIVIPRGMVVRWKNAATVFHTVTPDNASQPGVWTRRAMNGSGETFSHTFATAGQTYTYYCEPHLSAGMTGRIRVE